MKIALISSFALKTPPLGTDGKLSYGGLEICVFNHAEYLAKLGHEVSIIAARGSKAPPNVSLIETVPSWDVLSDSEKQELGKKDGVERNYGNLKWFAHTWNGWRAHEAEAFHQYVGNLSDYDVVGDNSWSKWSYSSGKQEIVGICHSVNPYQAKPREFAMFAGVSRGHARSLSRGLHTPVRTVHNPVNIDRIPLRPVKEDFVLSLNRIMPQKGIHGLISIMEKYSDYKAVVAGDDSKLVPDQGYVDMIRKRCQATKNIAYKGLVSDEEKLDLLQRAKVTVCLKDMGYEEVFGLQAVESMAAGTPVIALRSWGFEDTIKPENGLLCDNAEQVQEAIKKVMDGTVKFDPVAVRESAKAFSPEVVTPRFEKMLQRVKDGIRW